MSPRHESAVAQMVITNEALIHLCRMSRNTEDILPEH